MGHIRRSLTLNTLGVVGVAATGFASMLVLARALPVEAFGTVSIALMVANAVAGFDAVRPVIVYLATRRDMPLASLHRRAFGLLVSMGIVAAALTFALASALWSEEIGLAGTLLLASAVFLYFPAACDWGFLDARNDTLYTGMARSIGWMAVYASYMSIAPFSARASHYVLPLLVMNAGLVFAYRLRLGRIANAPATRAVPTKREILRHSLDNLWLNAAATVLGTVDRVVLSAVSGMQGVGLYSAQYELATKPSALLRVASSVLFPAAARSHAAGEGVIDAWLRLTLLAALVLAVPLMVAIGARERVIGILLGKAYAPHADVFGILLMAFWLQLLGYASAVLLNAQGNFSLQRRCYVWAAAAMLVAVVPVVREFGIVGLALLYLFVRGVDVVLFVSTLRLSGRCVHWESLLVPSFAVIVGFGLAWQAQWVATIIGSCLCALMAYALRRAPAERFMDPAP